MSPYLFLIVMTAMFHDIHQQTDEQNRKHRVTNTNFDEILFADDTICISESAKQLSTFLHKIQTEGHKYGLQLNLNKCEVIRISRTQPFTNLDEVRFDDGTKVKVAAQAKYLGCWLNSRGDPQQEIKQRLAICMTILKKLDIYWLKANPSVLQKLIVYDAIIRSKLIYGLESTALNETVKRPQTFLNQRDSEKSQV